MVIFLKDIIIALIISFVGYIAGRLLETVRLYKNRNKIVFLDRKHFWMPVIWHVYHYTNGNNGQEMLLKYKWEMGLNRIVAKPENNNLPTYKGKVVQWRGGVLSFEMTDDSSEEYYYVYASNTIRNEENIYTLIKVGVDFKHNPYSTIYLFSRKDINIVEAGKIIKQHADGNYMLKLK